MTDRGIGCILKCGRARKTRGLCNCCYNQMRKLVRTGEATWACLEMQGRALKRTRPQGWMWRRGY